MLASVPKRPRSESCFFVSLFFFFPDMFSCTLLPLQGKTTRPGVLVRNYDLDARCGLRPSFETPGRATQPPWPMLRCCIARASRPVRCRSGRHHSVARICWSPGGAWVCAWVSTASVLHSALPCPATAHCHCRVWEAGNGRNVAMPSADFLGRERRHGVETRRLVRTNRLRRVGCVPYYCIQNAAQLS